ncbi:MAG: S49 family peptidase, partial [Chlorobiaceae bacterium]|nr:S49 family peptidase [Chlorobiaceae bacterium]
GRVWSGKRAVEVGLVDRIGGLDDAVREAQKLAKMDAKAKPELLYLPVRKTWFERLVDGSMMQATAAISDHLVTRSFGHLLPATSLPGTETARFLLRTESPQILALDPVEVVIK